MSPTPLSAGPTDDQVAEAWDTIGAALVAEPSVQCFLIATGWFGLLANILGIALVGLKLLLWMYRFSF